MVREPGGELGHPDAAVVVVALLEGEWLPTEPLDGEAWEERVADSSGEGHRYHVFCYRAPSVVASLAVLQPLGPPHHGITQAREHSQGCLLLLTGNQP